MPRSLKEWAGRTDDTPVPPRVRLRVLDRFGHKCNNCKRPLRPGDAWELDHMIPLILSGPNRESNLRPMCAWCHPVKTAEECAEKSRNYKRALSHAGIRRAVSRPLVGTIASGWRKRMNGGWERRS